MKGSRTNRMLLVAVGVVAALLFAWYMLSNNFDWDETYRNNSKEPYGSFVLYESLKTYFPKEQFITIDERLSDFTALDTASGTYIFVGNVLHLNGAGISRLLSFVERGNTAFLSVKALPFSSFGLNDVLCVEMKGLPSLLDSVMTTKLTHHRYAEDTPFVYRRLIEHQPVNYGWTYIDRHECVTEDVAPRLGTLDGDKTNFVSLMVGEGRILLHTTPLVFTNYYMIDSHYVRYAEQVLSYVGKGDIYWDEAARDYIAGESGMHDAPETPLRFILSQRSLRWAWYLLLVSIVLYILLYMKRRQKVIPIIPPYQNTSLEFVKTVGSLYLAQKNHKQLALQQMKLLLAHVRNRYHLNTTQDEDQLITDISRKAQVDAKLVKRIFSKKKSIDLRNEIEADDLIEFHKLIEDFYNKAK